MLTLAVHTYRHALELQARLKADGINSELSPIEANQQGPQPGVRVRIENADLPKALRIVEREADNDMASLNARLKGLLPILLIPVDFSDHSDLAVVVGFDLAARLHLKPVLLHAFISPYFQGDMYRLNDSMVDENELDMAEEVMTLRQQATVEMDKMKARIRLKINNGTLPAIDFSTELREGIPEEVILQYVKRTPPSFIVMATRGTSRRVKELVGSVTAEVLDSCRVPLFIVPEHYNMPSIRSVSKVLFFCNLDQQDILSMDTFQRMFSFPADAEIHLVSVNPRVVKMASKLNALATYFGNNYPDSKFVSLPLPVDSNFRSSLEEMMEKHNIQLLVVPNRRRNIFQRLFNPSVAHRILFEKDIPMIALPS